MANLKTRPAVILLAEDDPHDRRLTERALTGSKVRNKLAMVKDGEEALDYLYNRGAYADALAYPKPDLILLDLNMPKVDGREVLKIIKNDDLLKLIPVVVLTTSAQEEDVLRSYHLGVNSYITKPVDLDQFVQAIRDLEHYWLELVVFPPVT